MADVKRIEKDIEALYRISAPCEEGCTRLSYTPAYREGVEYLKSRMAEFGMQVREDRIGTPLRGGEGLQPRRAEDCVRLPPRYGALRRGL